MGSRILTSATPRGVPPVIQLSHRELSVVASSTLSESENSCTYLIIWSFVLDCLDWEFELLPSCCSIIMFIFMLLILLLLDLDSRIDGAIMEGTIEREENENAGS